MPKNGTAHFVDNSPWCDWANSWDVAEIMGRRRFLRSCDPRNAASKAARKIGITAPTPTEIPPAFSMRAIILRVSEITARAPVGYLASGTTVAQIRKTYTCRRKPFWRSSGVRFRGEGVFSELKGELLKLRPGQRRKVSFLRDQ